MKILLIVSGITLPIFIGGILVYFNKAQVPDTSMDSELPTAPPVLMARQDQPIPNQHAVAGTQPQIAHAFLGQLQNSDLITLKGTVVASTYALQEWGDENTAGLALLKYDSSEGWKLISMGGGVWTSLALINMGVPSLIAEQLIAGSRYRE